MPQTIETITPAPDALRVQLDAYLRCPTEPAREELDAALRAYQTGWIRAHAGADAPLPAGTSPATAPTTAPTTARTVTPKPKFPIAAADRDVLARMADGWVPTTADVPRWVWFENRELVTLAPNPAGQGPEVMRLAPAGWAAVGRNPA